MCRMLGAHTRLKCSAEESAVLDRAMVTFGNALHWAYGASQTSNLPALRKTLNSRFNLPAKWQEGIVVKVEQMQSEATGRKAWLLTSQTMRLEALTGYIAKLDKRIQSLTSRLTTLGKRGIAKAFQKPGKEKELQAKLDGVVFKRFYKNRKLLALQQEHETFKTADPLAHRVFGGRKLLAQRHRVGEESSPFPGEESWRAEWNRRRHGEIWLAGCGKVTCGNQAAQIDVKENTLTLRLPDDQAQERLKAEAERLGIAAERVSNKLHYKRLILKNVSFSPKHAKQISLAQSLKLPITVQIKKKHTPKGKRQFAKKKENPEVGYYLHVSYDLPAPQLATSHAVGVLGVDLNAKSLAWAMADHEGNPARAVKTPDGTTRVGEDSKDSKPSPRHLLHGTIPLDLTGLTSHQAKALVQEAVNHLVDMAKSNQSALAIENLDFSYRKAGAKEKGAGYSRMISGLRTAGFAEAIRSRCRKEGVALLQVNPRWTSVAGYVKYGLRFGMTVDQAAAFAIARIGLLAKRPERKPLPTHIQNGPKTGHKLSPKFIRMMQSRRESIVLSYQESVSLPQPVPRLFQKHRKQTGQTEALTWKKVRVVVGRDRRNWPNRLRGLANLKSRTRRLSSPALFLARKAKSQHSVRKTGSGANLKVTWAS